VLQTWHILAGEALPQVSGRCPDRGSECTASRQAALFVRFAGCVCIFSAAPTICVLFHGAVSVGVSVCRKRRWRHFSSNRRKQSRRRALRCEYHGRSLSLGVQLVLRWRDGGPSGRTRRPILRISWVRARDSLSEDGHAVRVILSRVSARFFCARTPVSTCCAQGTTLSA
jgi:hypothetical protein